MRQPPHRPADEPEIDLDLGPRASDVGPALGRKWSALSAHLHPRLPADSRQWLLPGHGKFRALVPLIALAAGLLFATTEVTAAGTDLRSGSRTRLTDLIADRSRDIRLLNQTAVKARADVERSTAEQAARDARVAEQRRAAAALSGVSGLDPVTGGGLTVSLDDSSRSVGDPVPAGVDEPSPDDLVVHQQDVQAVVNALWVGGARAMTIMGQRVIATSAVRCVGNTLLLHGQVYSPPFIVAAVGDQDRMRAALDDAPGVALFREYVNAYNLGFDVAEESSLNLPGYEGTIELEHAKAVE